ncbi:MAG TPA: hypothetical protein VFA60_14355 [Terriglobales bacterium]|nr:hypothetical protein [Terriglobales bacterium]
MHARQRPAMVKTSDEMQRWSAMLAGEIASLPGVSERAMFGMRAFYRGAQIFAALPRTRGLRTANGFIFKLKGAPERVFQRVATDKRIAMGVMGGKQQWAVFQMGSDADLHDAIEWLNQAWDVSGKEQGKRKK